MWDIRAFERNDIHWRNATGQGYIVIVVIPCISSKSSLLLSGKKINDYNHLQITYCEIFLSYFRKPAEIHSFWESNKKLCKKKFNKFLMSNVSLLCLIHENVSFDTAKRTKVQNGSGVKWPSQLMKSTPVSEQPLYLFWYLWSYRSSIYDSGSFCS